MPHAKLTSKGQVTIPSEARKALGLRAGDQVSFTVFPGGTVILCAKTRALEDLAGMLEAPAGVSVPIDEMKP